MEIDAEEDTFYLRFFYVFISLSANKGIFMANMQKLVKSRQSNCGFNS